MTVRGIVAVVVVVITERYDARIAHFRELANLF